MEDRIRELAAEADYEISRTGNIRKADARKQTERLKGFLDQFQQFENDVKKHVAERAGRPPMFAKSGSMEGPDGR